MAEEKKELAPADKARLKAEFDRERFPTNLFRPYPEKAGKFLLDLRSANRWVLCHAGIKPQNIYSIDACTHCDPNLLSYRRDRSRVGRMYAFIGINV